MKMKKLIALLLLFCILMSSASISYAADVQLSVSAVEQRYPMWCWAACCEMSGKYYYNYKTSYTSIYTQTDVVTYVHGYPNPSYGGTPAQIETGCEYVAYDEYNAADIAAAATFSNIVGFINLNKPTIACIYSLNGNHAVTIYGYNNNNGNTTVYYIDPNDGDFCEENYVNFATTVVPGGSWDYTVAWY